MSLFDRMIIEQRVRSSQHVDGEFSKLYDSSVKKTFNYGLTKIIENKFISKYSKTNLDLHSINLFQIDNILFSIMFDVFDFSVYKFIERMVYTNRYNVQNVIAFMIESWKFDNRKFDIFEYDVLDEDNIFISVKYINPVFIDS